MLHSIIAHNYSTQQPTISFSCTDYTNYTHWSCLSMVHLHLPFIYTMCFVHSYSNNCIWQRRLKQKLLPPLATNYSLWTTIEEAIHASLNFSFIGKILSLARYFLSTPAAETPRLWTIRDTRGDTTITTLNSASGAPILPHLRSNRNGRSCHS